jgi:hypothetical protein
MPVGAVVLGAVEVVHPPESVVTAPHGPHSLGLAEGAGDAAVWTRLAMSWIREYAADLKR